MDLKRGCQSDQSLVDRRQLAALQIFDNQPPSQTDGCSIDQVNVVTMLVFDHRVAPDAQNFVF
jgi:hypothetical protein